MCGIERIIKNFPQKSRIIYEEILKEHVIIVKLPPTYKRIVCGKLRG